MSLKRIVFEFKDEQSRGEWIRRECIVPSLEYCMRIYGLEHCEHRILEITEVNK